VANPYCDKLRHEWRRARIASRPEISNGAAFIAMAMSMFWRDWDGDEVRVPW
jgi:hypothetical protein